jgi:hypothetical protein
LDHEKLQQVKYLADTLKFLRGYSL